MSEVLEKIRTRRSVRKYKPDMVPRELIDKVIDAGLYAASGVNHQSSIIIAVTDKEVRDRFAKVNAEIWGRDMDPFYGAPAVLIVLDEKDWRNHVYDGSLVMGNMMLAAHELGLGSCWVNRAKEAFEMDEFKEFLKSLGIEGEYEGIGNLILGYPDGEIGDPLPRKENRVYYV